jgi:hypothetical protein
LDTAATGRSPPIAREALRTRPQVIPFRAIQFERFAYANLAGTRQRRQTRDSQSSMAIPARGDSSFSKG